MTAVRRTARCSADARACACAAELLAVVQMMQQPASAACSYASSDSTGYRGHGSTASAQNLLGEVDVEAVPHTAAADVLRAET